MQFEKWQALGNDYVILEEEAIAFELTPERIRASVRSGRESARTASCFCPGAGTWLPGQGADLQPRRFPRPRCPGTALARPILYMHRRAGPRPTRSRSRRQPASCGHDHLSDHVHGRHGASPAAKRRLSSRRRGRPGRAGAGGRTWRFQHVQVGNPQCAIRVGEEDELEALDLRAIGPEIENHELFPNRTNVSWFTELEPGRIRARIFERGAGRRRPAGPAPAVPPWPTRCEGGDSPVTAVLDGGELRSRWGRICV